MYYYLPGAFQVNFYTKKIYVHNILFLFPADIQVDPSPECLAIIAQPCCSSKVRYRKDYLSPSKRRDPLMNKTPDSNYKGPAIYVR